MVTLHFDGLCEPKNPGGIACYGWLIRRGDRVLAQGKGVVACGGPRATNNVAEYTALIKGLEAVVALDPDEVEVRGDSQLIIYQMAGQYAVRSWHLRPLWKRAQALVRRLRQVRFRWVPREQNAEADALAWQAYRQAMAKRER